MSLDKQTNWQRLFLLLKSRCGLLSKLSYPVRIYSIFCCSFPYLFVLLCTNLSHFKCLLIKFKLIRNFFQIKLRPQESKLKIAEKKKSTQNLSNNLEFVCVCVFVCWWRAKGCWPYLCRLSRFIPSCRRHKLSMQPKHLKFSRGIRKFRIKPNVVAHRLQSWSWSWSWSRSGRRRWSWSRTCLASNRLANANWMGIGHKHTNAYACVACACVCLCGSLRRAHFRGKRSGWDAAGHLHKMLYLYGTNKMNCNNIDAADIEDTKGLYLIRPPPSGPAVTLKWAMLSRLDASHCELWILWFVQRGNC